MSQLRSIATMFNNHRSATRPAWLFLFTGLLGLLLAWNSSSAFAEQPLSARVTYHQHIQELSQLNTTAQFTHSNRPYEQAPKAKNRELPSENENENENETEEDTDIDGSPAAHPAALGVAVAVSEMNAGHACRSAQYRTVAAVPLFVLYHAWKSFVA